MTWAACENDPGSAPECAGASEFAQPILEPTNSGPTAAEVLRNAVIYLVLANPDGWRRGDLTDGGVFYQRYNGNGMDLNRDWPTVGYTEAQYTPGSEPETRGFAEFLQSVRERTSANAFTGAMDLHGMLTAPSFSFTLLGAGQRDFRRNALTVDTSIRTFRDSEQRLSWSNLIATQEEGCPGEVEVPELGGTLPMCSDQWGTVWDTINYQITGGFADWMESPIGLDALGIDNEMALSHLTPNNVFDPEVEQLHIDGNKGLIFSQIAAMLEEQPVEFRPDGKVGYIFDPRRITNPGGEPVEGPEGLPTQDTIEHTSSTGIAEFAFDVKGTDDGFFNGGLTVEATFGNVDGISTNSLATLILDYCGPPQHPGDEEGCREVARYFNQSPVYLQAGARIDLNSPPVGPYRIRAPGAGSAHRLRDIVQLRAGLRPAGTAALRRVPDGLLRRPEQVRPGRQRADPDPGARCAQGQGPHAGPLRHGGRGRRLHARLRPHWRAGGGRTAACGRVRLRAGVVSRSARSGRYLRVRGPRRLRQRPDGRGGDLGDPQRLRRHRRATRPGKRRVAEARLRVRVHHRGRGNHCVRPRARPVRVRLQNFLAAPQQVDGTITFFSDPAPEAEDALPSLGTGIAPDAVTGGFFYAGWMDFNDGDGPTYDRHHLAAGVNKEGTAEGRATVDGHDFVNRHQTYEPVPIGYYVSPPASANADCDSDRCDSPNWIVAGDAWEDAGGTTAARTLVRTAQGPGPSKVGVSLGELPLGQGQIRIAGGLMPEPTEENLHPYGLRSYALTYTGYQLFENLLKPM